MTICFIWQLRVTLDSICNSCDVSRWRNAWIEIYVSSLSRSTISSSIRIYDIILRLVITRGPNFNLDIDHNHISSSIKIYCQDIWYHHCQDVEQWQNLGSSWRESEEMPEDSAAKSINSIHSHQIFCFSIQNHNIFLIYPQPWNMSNSRVFAAFVQNIVLLFKYLS